MRMLSSWHANHCAGAAFNSWLQPELHHLLLFEMMPRHFPYFKSQLNVNYLIKNQFFTFLQKLSQKWSLAFTKKIDFERNTEPIENVVRNSTDWNRTGTATCRQFLNRQPQFDIVKIMHYYCTVWIDCNECKCKKIGKLFQIPLDNFRNWRNERGKQRCRKGRSPCEYAKRGMQMRWHWTKTAHK